MLQGVRAFFRTHPILREVLFWSVPALLVGAILRALLLSYQPYAYWGSDSRSYYSFAHLLLEHGKVSLDEKRRYVYPLLMVPVSLLPGAPLKWIAWIQHLLGLSAVLPLAYAVRRSFRFGKWWIIPVTLAYATTPIFLWYEHELLGESFFFVSLAWAIGGWVAWVAQKDPAAARARFWWFFIPLALFLLTKPSGRFILPGIVLGLLTVRAWRILKLRHGIALVLLFTASLTVGTRKQGAWLLYVSTFPLTQFDTPLYSDYKAAIRDYAKPYVDRPEVYFITYKEGLNGAVAPFHFLESPKEERAPPPWAALSDNAGLRQKVYTALAIEGIRARPAEWLGMGMERVILSANLSEFKVERFASSYYPAKVKVLWSDAQDEIARGKRSSVPMAFGLGRKDALPPFAEFSPRLAPAAGGIAERTVTSWVDQFHRVSDVVKLPPMSWDPPRVEGRVLDARPTFLGWWLIAGTLCSLVYWRTFGIWAVTMCGYLAMVFLITHTSVRFFAPAWLILIPVLAAPLDLILRVFRRR